MSTLIAEKPTTITTAKAPGNPDFWVNVGESFEIKLTENPTTGYVWALVNLPENFYLLSDSYQPDQPVRPGSGGTRHFYFVAMKPKIQGDFAFYQLKPWEPFAPIAESMWHVNVH